MNLSHTSDSDFILKLTEIVLQNLENEHFGVDELAYLSGLGVNVLRHRLKTLTKKTISQLIAEVRVNKAHELIQLGSLTVSEVAWKTGFGSPEYFIRCYHDFYGHSPGEEMKKGTNGNYGQKYVDEFKPDGSAPGRTDHKKNKVPLRIYFRIIVVVFLLSTLFFLVRQSFFVSSGRPLKKEVEKSIAVLPFRDDSRDSSNIHLINGIMNSILDDLSRIKDLRVVSRESVEPYRNNRLKSVPKIARELGVNYILEGSGEKYDDLIRVSIRLIQIENERQLLSDQYTEKIEDIFTLESKIAIKIASSIKAVISPQEIEMIKLKPANNIAAVNMYNAGMDLKYTASVTKDPDLIPKAEQLFRKAIEIDSTFAPAYVQVAWLIYTRNLDSALLLVNKALQNNPYEAHAYYILGRYYSWYKNSPVDAEKNFLLAIKYNPNYSSPHVALGEIYKTHRKFPEALKSELIGLKLEGNSLQTINHLAQVCYTLLELGFTEEGLKLASERFKFDPDSSLIVNCLTERNIKLGKFNETTTLASNFNKGLNSIGLSSLLSLMQMSLYKRDYQGAYICMEKYFESLKKNNYKIAPMGTFGQIYQRNGMHKEADWHYEQAIERYLKTFKEGQSYQAGLACYNLVYCYSGKGEKGKALEYLQKLKRFNDLALIQYGSNELRYDPSFDTVRDEPEFGEFFREMESRFIKIRKECEKVLREEGLLVKN